MERKKYQEFFKKMREIQLNELQVQWQYQYELHRYQMQVAAASYSSKQTNSNRNEILVNPSDNKRNHISEIPNSHRQILDPTSS
jgi:hypothetical protein